MFLILVAITPNFKKKNTTTNTAAEKKNNTAAETTTFLKVNYTSLPSGVPSTPEFTKIQTHILFLMFIVAIGGLCCWIVYAYMNYDNAVIKRLDEDMIKV